MLDACRDATAEVGRHATAAELGLTARRSTARAQGRGARRLGMDAAAERLLSLGRPRRPDRLHRRRLPRRRRTGSSASSSTLARRRRRDRRARSSSTRRGRAAARARCSSGARRDAADAAGGACAAVDPDAAHHHFAGASLGVTAAAYRAVGGIEPLAALEDAAFAERLAAARDPDPAPADVRVATSARTDGRAARGLSVDLAVSTWSDAPPLPRRRVQRRRAARRARRGDSRSRS